MNKPVERVNIKMLETTKGCDNDLHKYQAEEYCKDKIYTVGPDLAESFIEVLKVAKVATKSEIKAASDKEAKESEADENKEAKGDDDK